MKKIINAFITLNLLFTTSSFGQSPETDSYQSYNQIVNDLNSELETKTESTQAKLLNSSYSLAAGLQTQFLKIQNTSESLFGFGGELGVYNFLLFPIKIGLDFVSATDIKSTLFNIKTDYSVYKYNLIDVKASIAAGLSRYKKKGDSFTSIYLAPSIATYYQLNKNFDLNINLSYAFHGSNEVADHISPSVNIVSYF